MEFKKFEKELISKLDNYFSNLECNNKFGNYYYIIKSLKYFDRVAIYIGFNKLSNLYRIYFSMARYINLIEELWIDLDRKTLANYTVGLGLGSDAKTITLELNANDENALEKAFNYIVDNYENKYKERLDYYSNIQVLNTVFNSTVDNLNVYPASLDGIWFKKLIIAKLSGNPNFQLIYNYLDNMFQEILKEKPNNIKWEKRYEILKEVYQRVSKLDKLKNPNLISE